VETLSGISGERGEDLGGGRVYKCPIGDGWRQEAGRKSIASSKTLGDRTEVGGQLLKLGME